MTILSTLPLPSILYIHQDLSHWWLTVHTMKKTQFFQPVIFMFCVLPVPTDIRLRLWLLSFLHVPSILCIHMGLSNWWLTVTHYEEDTVFSACNFLVLQASGPHRYSSQAMTTRPTVFAITTLHTYGPLQLMTDSHTLWGRHSFFSL